MELAPLPIKFPKVQVVPKDTQQLAADIEKHYCYKNHPGS